MRTRGTCQRDDVLANGRVNMHRAYLLLNLHQFFSAHDLFQIIKGMMELMGIKNIDLVLLPGISQGDIHHKAVKLGLRERKGAFIFDGILRSHDHKRIWQMIGGAINSQLRLLHSFEQSRLRFWSRAVDFVSQDNLRHNRARSEFKIACFLVINRNAGDIAWQKIRGKLNALERAAYRARDSLGKYGLP